MESADALTDPRYRSATVGWTRYLPALLFIAFFIPNTRFALSETMSAGRWIILATVLTLALLTTRRLRNVPALSVFAGLSLLPISLTLPYSSNVPISVAKWLVFASFLAFWFLFGARIRGHRDVHHVLQPMVVFFFVFMWSTPLASLFFPQPLWGYFRHLNGFLVFTNALGQFMIFFGLPAVLYKLETSTVSRQRLTWQVSLVLAVALIFFSGSRTAGFTMVFLLAVAFVRWRRWKGRLALPVQALVIVALVLTVPSFMGELRTFVYKYPGVSTLLESRSAYWQNTRESFRKRHWTGSGFGVQEQQAESRLSVSSAGSFREQGSAYLGMLEEVGIVGSVPFFVLLLILAFKSGRILLRSDDPLKIFLARTIVSGLLWGLTENYMLYLGNAASMLFFNAVFLQERLLQLENSARTMTRHRQSWAAQLHAAGLRTARAG